jgi:hypothetical protein
MDYNSGQYNISTVKPTNIAYGGTKNITNVLTVPTMQEIQIYIYNQGSYANVVNETYWEKEVFKNLCTFQQSGSGGFTNIPIHLPFPFNTVIYIPMPTVLIEQAEEIRQKIEEKLKEYIPTLPTLPTLPPEFKRLLNLFAGLIILYILYKILKKYL